MAAWCKAAGQNKKHHRHRPIGDKCAEFGVQTFYCAQVSCIKKKRHNEKQQNPRIYHAAAATTTTDQQETERQHTTAAAPDNSIAGVRRRLHVCSPHHAVVY